MNELLEIEEALDPTKPGQKGIVLYGIGGSGKTQLTLHYIEQYQQLYTAILWINASTIENIKQSFIEIANMISSSWPPRDLPITYLGSNERQKVIARLRSTCHTRWLLIVDSADDLSQNFRQYIPTCNHGSIIITSMQNEASEVFGFSKLEVDHLDLDSGRALLLARACDSMSDADISEDGKSCSSSLEDFLTKLSI